MVRESLWRMENNEDARSVRLARPTAEDIVADVSVRQLEGIRRRVRASAVALEADEHEDLRWSR